MTTGPGQPQKSASNTSNLDEEDDANLEVMEIDKATNIDLPNTPTKDTEENETDSTNSEEMEDADPLASRSVLGKRKAFKPAEELSDDYCEAPKQKREKLGLRSRKPRNYSEDAEDSAFEIPEEQLVVPANESTGGAEETVTTETEKKVEWVPRVEKILAHRYNDKGEIEYYVKWKDRSYLHVSWIGPEEFNDRYSKRKVVRYHKKEETLLEEGDEGDVFNSSFLEIDRIICHYDGGEQPEYLVKWEQMSYTDVTWEFESDIKDDYKIAEYRARIKPPSPKSWKTKPRPPPESWEAYKESPKYKGGNELRSYQLEGLNWLTFCWYNKRNSILADEMGLGKTVQTVSALYHLFTKCNMHGPFLIVAPLITVPHWQREFESWTDMNAVVYHGTAAAREIIRKYEWSYNSLKGSPPPYKFHVLITTYEMILTDTSILSKIHWKYLAVDEAHRLKNTKCKLINALRLFHFDHLLLLTGTPLQNNTEELWTLLNFMDPDKFASADEFSSHFGDLKDTKQVEELHEILRPYLLRRMKEDVEKTIAPKEETIVEVELTTIQKSYYRAIFERNFSSLNMGAKASNVPSLLNIMMQLRKCCNHPYLLRGVEDNIIKQYKHDDADENELMINSCGKLVLVDKLLAKLKESGHKVLIFSQMIRMLDILEDYLIHKSYAYERIDGNKRGNERQEAIDRFSAPDSDRFVFLLCTRAGGLGINLTAADTCIIYDSDWNPQNDIQAQARCHRIGQTQKVKIYRLITRNTYEKVMFQKASLKLGLDQVVLTKMKSAATTDDSNMTANAALRAMDKKEIEELLRFGAYKTFTDDDPNSNEKFDEQDIDQILERNSTTIIHDCLTSTENAPSSSFSTASFISANAESNAHVDVSDPDFWKKLLPEEHAKLTNTGNHESDSSPKQGSRYSFRDTSDRFPLYGVYLSSDEDVLEIDDDGDANFDYGSGASWTSRERAKIKSTLSYYGYGQWATIRQVGKLHRWSIRQIQAYADALILNCVTQIESESPHALLSFLQKWTIYEDHPATEPRDDGQFVDFSLDPSLTDPNFSLYKPSNAKPFVRKLENIAKVCKAVTEAYREHGENLTVPLTSGEKPCESWGPEDNRSLILGTYYHGYGRYEKMRTDPRLSFSRFSVDSSRNAEEIPDDMDTEESSVAPPVAQQESKPSSEEGTAAADSEMTSAAEEWPLVKVLHRQLRKALRVLTSDEDTYVPDAKTDELEENQNKEDETTLMETMEKKKKRYFSSHEWSKREKQAVYRFCVAFGIPEESDEAGWEELKLSASLTRKTMEQIQLYCEALIDTAEVIADKDRTEPSTDWSVQVDADLKLTKAQSKRLVQRVRIFKDIRKFLLPRLEELTSLLISARKNAMPDWWVPSEHDYALIHGILKHGFGQWEKLCADKDFPFLKIAEEKLSGKKEKSVESEASQKSGDGEIASTANAETSVEESTTALVPPEAAISVSGDIRSSKSSLGATSEDDDDDDDDNENDTEEIESGSRKRRRGRRADVYTTAMNFPKEKAILKRIRYLIKFINDANLPPPPPGAAAVVIPRRAPLKLSTDSLTNLSPSTSSPATNSPRTNRSKPKVCAGRKPATKKYHEIPSHEDGSPIFPIVFGKMRIESLGTVVHEKPNFHNDRYIWPVGYRSVRPYQSFVDSTARTDYTSEIIDGGDRPLFQVTAADAPDRPGQGSSPTAAWTCILRKLNEKTNKPFNAVSGPEYFGLAKGIITKLIQELPNADKCTNYQPQEFILDKAPQPRKKRKSKSISTTIIPPSIDSSQNPLRISHGALLPTSSDNSLVPKPHTEPSAEALQFSVMPFPYSNTSTVEIPKGLPGSTLTFHPGFASSATFIPITTPTVFNGNTNNPTFSPDTLIEDDSLPPMPCIDSNENKPNPPSQ